MSDVACGVAIHELLKDAPDHVGLLLDDDESTLCAGDRFVAVGSPPGVPRGADHRSHAAPCFGDAVLALQLSDDGTKPDCNGVGGPVVDGAYFNPAKGQALVEAGKVLHVARQAIQRLDDNDIEGADLALLD